jgi:hypothetical protein
MAGEGNPKTLSRRREQRMLQDYRQLDRVELELLEKQTLRTILQALQEYSREAKQIFDNTAAESDTEVIVLAEDLVQYALEVAECYPINKRFAGFIDYKRFRWISTPFGLFPQVLLVDAKASTENNRETLQQSQLPMDADFRTTDGQAHSLTAGVLPDVPVVMRDGTQLAGVTTSAFIHFYYKHLDSPTPPYRDLKSIFALLIPHQSLKPVYNPSPDITFFGQGKHSPARGEKKRIRVYFNRLRQLCPWRLQELKYTDGSDYTAPVWRDMTTNDLGGIEEVLQDFLFIGR